MRSTQLISKWANKNRHWTLGTLGNGTWMSNGKWLTTGNLLGRKYTVFGYSVGRRSSWLSQRNLLIAGAAIAALGVAGTAYVALSRRLNPGAAAFIEDASMKGLAEIEAAKLALQKSLSSNVKAFAQQMIDDHTSINRELRAIALRKNLPLADEVTLLDKAKAFALQHKAGQSFDRAYAEFQVASHKAAIRLFRRAAKSDDIEVRQFAAITLSKLQHHLQMAQDLTKTVCGRGKSARSLLQNTAGDGLQSTSGVSDVSAPRASAALSGAREQPGSPSLHS